MDPVLLGWPPTGEAEGWAAEGLASPFSGILATRPTLPLLPQHDSFLREQAPQRCAHHQPQPLHVPEPLLPLGSVRGAAFWLWGALGGLWSGVGAGLEWALLAQSRSGMAFSSSACVSSSSRLMSLALYWVRAARFSSQSRSAALRRGAECQDLGGSYRVGLGGTSSKLFAHCPCCTDPAPSSLCPGSGGHLYHMPAS